LLAFTNRLAEISSAIASSELHRNARIVSAYQGFRRCDGTVSFTKFEEDPKDLGPTMPSYPFRFPIIKERFQPPAYSPSLIAPEYRAVQRVRQYKGDVGGPIVVKRFHALQGGGAAVLMIGLAVSPAAPLNV